MTATSAPLTADLEAGALFDRLGLRPEWHGYGYLGRRLDFRPDQREVADELLLAAAVEAGLSEDELMAWADARVGRWAGDVLGEPGQPHELRERLARFGLLPSRWFNGQRLELWD
ncbi:hypothetical protein [Aeromicrobium sp. Leaf291]|uniref:hypothetical protein n=1 Tax=Aeromicrobium sp. Leaf291 TaxID=1736325 RepID=UPI0006F1D276|nr:hypothetical protein [Aeromicrobium sp. Leaf291]KQP81599.1 hypothetical protein ASF35_16340 [Aeromicrobium sp. Leaf291]